jgi:DNA-directed RNA polymerase subunit RPC12/RpoP
MSLLDRVKDAFRTTETISWECQDCGDVFTTDVPESGGVPKGVSCETCGSTAVQEINRSYG